MEPLNALSTVGDVIAGKYRIEKLIGQGATSAVFLCTVLTVEVPVAVKVLSSQSADGEGTARFLRELRTGDWLDHPNLVLYLDAGVTNDESTYMAMEYCAGETLEVALAAGRLTPSERVEVIVHCLSGLQAAHKRDIVHRDIKPSNILLARFGRGDLVVKLLDYGMAMIRQTASGVDGSFTRTGVLLGTAPYIAPEQLSAATHVDARADIYACGVVLYQALTGQVPFESTNHDVLWANVMKGDPSALGGHIPRGLQAIVTRALAREPSERFQTAVEMRRALSAYIESRPPDMEPWVLRVLPPSPVPMS